MIYSKEQLSFKNEKLCIILGGVAGIGKTTLALSAPKPLLIDLDNYFMYLDEIISSSKMEKVKKSACQEYLDEIERVIQEIYDLQ